MYTKNLSVNITIGQIPYLIHGQLDLSPEGHQGADDSQDPEQEEKYRGSTASYPLQLDDAEG